LEVVKGDFSRDTAGSLLVGHQQLAVVAAGVVCAASEAAVVSSSSALAEEAPTSCGTAVSGGLFLFLHFLSVLFAVLFLFALPFRGFILFFTLRLQGGLLLIFLVQVSAVAAALILILIQQEADAQARALVFTAEVYHRNRRCGKRHFPLRWRRRWRTLQCHWWGLAEALKSQESEQRDKNLKGGKVMQML
jgi:hypothetical protein